MTPHTINGKEVLLIGPVRKDKMFTRDYIWPWQLLGKGLVSQVTEEEAAGVVEEAGETYQFHGKIKHKYTNYQYGYQGWSCNSAVASLHSLVRSLGYEPENCCLLIKN